MTRDLGFTVTGSLGHLILHILSLPEAESARLATVQLIAMPTHPENVRVVLHYYIGGGEVRIADDCYYLTRHGRDVLAELGEYRHA